MPPYNKLLYLYNCNILSQPNCFVNNFKSSIYLIKNSQKYQIRARFFERYKVKKNEKYVERFAIL